MNIPESQIIILCTILWIVLSYLLCNIKNPFKRKAEDHVESIDLKRIGNNIIISRSNHVSSFRRYQ